jgi:hypothetical protein
MGFWGTTGIAKDERQRCLAYYEAEVGVTAFQTKEADLFNEVLAQYEDAIKENPEAARKVCKAAYRLVQAAREIIRRRDEIQPVPEAAFSMHWAWHVTSLTYSAWAQATYSAMETLANGQTPPTKYIQHLVKEHEIVWLRAQREEKQFLKQLRIPESEVEKIVEKSTEAAKNDHWQPELPSEFDVEEVVAEIPILSP